MSEVRQLKVLIVGDEAVGKTNFVNVYAGDSFSQGYVATVGIDFRVKEVTREGGETVKVQLWDTAGAERYASIVKAYYVGANGFVAMFDLTNQESFNKIRSIVEGIRENMEDAKMVLVGNKSDLTAERAISEKQAQELADSLKIRYFEVSVKDSAGVSEAVETVLVEEDNPEEEVGVEEVTVEGEISTEEEDVNVSKEEAPSKTKEETGSNVFMFAIVVVVACAAYYLLFTKSH